jgi:uroporphyrinogen decarboxylase
MCPTGRERILAALGGGGADRLPVEVGATPLTGVTAEAYPALKKALGIEGGNTRVSDPMAGLVRVERVFRERLGTDAVGLFPDPLKWRPGRLPDGTDCLFPDRWRTRPDGRGSEVFRHPITEQLFARAESEHVFRSAAPPLADCASPEDVTKSLQKVAFFDWPYHADELASEFGVRSRETRRGTDAACVLNVSARLMGGAFELRGHRLLGDLDEDEGVVPAILDRLADAYVARLTDVLPEVGPHADLVCLLEGPAPELKATAFNRLFRPRLERVLTHIRSTSGLPVVVMLRGVAPEVAREVAQLGVEGVGLGLPADGSSAGLRRAVAATAAQAGGEGVDPLAFVRAMRSACGEGVTLWGAGCPASVLTRADPEGAREAVKRHVEAAGGPGRLVFAFGEPLPPGTRLDTLLAALDAARELSP